MQEDTQVRGPAARGSGDASSDPNIGRVLDERYRIGRRIARGGMAGVYEAHDLRLDRTVAVKIMHAGLGDAGSEDAFADRFVREARAAARLSHPNVVAVYDQGEDDGTVYLAMELVPGHTLRDTIAQQAPMPPSRALALLDPVLTAVSAAHRAGLVHRDVKPENVLISDDGQVKVADFGLAKAVSAETQHTATNDVLIGTVSYLAPELVAEGKADARADVYAVGVILYELLTGAKPHTGDSAIQVAYRHVHHDVPPPSATVPGIPDYVDALVRRATARDASLRPADAAVLAHQAHRVAQALHDGVASDPELVADLTPAARAAAPEPAAVPPLPPPPAPAESTSVFWDQEVGYDAPEQPRRRRAWVLALVVALVVGLIGGGYWFGWARYTTAPSVVGLSQADAEDRLEVAGFEFDYGAPAYSEDVPKGDVIESDPGSGDRILPGGTVALTLSLGPERYDVPDLSGMTVDEASAALDEVKMVVGRQKERWSETVPEGRVIRSQPKYDTKKARNLPVDSAVTLVISKGRQPIEVQDWTGRSADEATQAMEAAGLTVEVTQEEFSDDVPDGHVIAQSPTDGSLYQGDVVKLEVSKGPPLVEVPSLSRESTKDAKKQLQELGFKVKVEKASIHLGLKVVASTDPPAGTEAPAGSEITIYEI